MTDGQVSAMELNIGMAVEDHADLCRTSLEYLHLCDYDVVLLAWMANSEITVVKSGGEDTYTRHHAHAHFSLPLRTGILSSGARPLRLRYLESGPHYDALVADPAAN